MNTDKKLREISKSHSLYIKSTPNQVANTAATKGFEPKAFCDQNVAVFKELNNLLGISNDRYIRTTGNYTFCLSLYSLSEQILAPFMTVDGQSFSIEIVF